MTSLDLNKLNPRVEIMNMQHRKISECIKTIHDEIADARQSCSHVNDLLYQLEQLCQMQFMYKEQLLEEVNYPSAAKQKHLHALLLKAIDQLKSEIEFLKGKLQLEQKSTRMLKSFISERNLSNDLRVYQKYLCVADSEILPVRQCICRPMRTAETLN